MNRKRLVGIAGICMLALTPLMAIDLTSIITEAKQNSSMIQLIELQRANSNLSISMGDIEETVGLDVSGSVSYSETSAYHPNVQNFEIYPSVKISLPNSGRSAITISANPITTALDGSGYWSVSPSVGVSHTFRFGDNGDNLSDLSYAKDRVTMEYDYRSSLYSFENSIYNKIVEILNYEKKLLDDEKNILVQKTQIENALALRTTTEGSPAFQDMQVKLAKLENTKASTLKLIAMAQMQYAQYTGLEWESVEEIPEADLSFTYLPTGDANVIAAAMDLEIAQENLALAQRRTVVTSTGTKTVPSLMLNGEAGFDYAKRATESIDYSVTAGATYNANNFSTNASVRMGITESGTVTPSVTIGGAWHNNPTVARDVLEMQRLENAVTMAGINYQNAMLSYQESASKLESDILNHQLSAAAFEQEAAYREEVLKQTAEAFNRGLVTETELNNAQLNVEFSTYERKIYALQALVLQNEAKALQL